MVGDSAGGPLCPAAPRKQLGGTCVVPTLAAAAAAALRRARGCTSPCPPWGHPGSGQDSIPQRPPSGSTWDPLSFALLLAGGGQLQHPAPWPRLCRAGRVCPPALRSGQGGPARSCCLWGRGGRFLPRQLCHLRLGPNLQRFYSFVKCTRFCLFSSKCFLNVEVSSKCFANI